MREHYRKIVVSMAGIFFVSPIVFAAGYEVTASVLLFGSIASFFYQLFRVAKP